MVLKNNSYSSTKFTRPENPSVGTGLRLIGAVDSIILLNDLKKYQQKQPIEI